MSDLPGGVITTHCVSTVVRPGSKQNHDPLQFVKIQSTELSQKAVEQIRLAEAVKITKEKIKEVEEEWQNNLLNWKSKRRQSRLTGGEESDSGDNQQRKIKTFSEILNEKAKSGQRIGYNLHKYIGMQDEEEEENLVITNNNNNNNDKRGTGSSRFSIGKNGSGDYLEDDDSNQFKNYEQQQAELQKKRQELNNKLQELEQLEKKQNELERQERINSPSSEISSPSPQISGNTSETARNDSPTVIVSIENKERQSNLSTTNVSKNCEMKQKQNDGYSEKKVFNFNSSSELTKREEYNCEPVVSVHENRQKSVWNYLLQQQDDPRGVHHSHADSNSDLNQHNLRPNSQYINADSESDDDHLNDSMDADEAAEKEQMLSFRAKLSTFESLSKSDASAQQQPSKQVKKSEKLKKTADQITARLFPTTTSANSSSSPSSSQTSSCTTLSAATPTVSVQNLKDLENNSVIKNRPPTVEDLAHKEEMKVLQQRLQNQNIVDQQKHFHSTQQPTLPVNSINQNSLQKLHPIQQQASLDKSWNPNSPSHLSNVQMSKVCNPQVNKGNNSLVHSHLQQHHYHSRTSSEETRESSSSTWETSNFVCDKEVEKISERMNRGNVIPAEFGGNGHETITSNSVHYNNSGLPATSMNQHYHSSSHLSHPHLLQQQQQQQQLQRPQYGYEQLKMNRHSVPNLNGLVRGYDQQQYYLMNEIIGDNQQMLSNNNANVNNTHNPVANNNNSNVNNNNNFTINNNIINSNGNNSNLNNGNNVNTTEDNYYSNQEQIDLIKKQMMLQKQNSYLNESTASYMQHASKSQSNLNGTQISNLSGQQPSELTTSPTYLPIHQQRAVNQSLLRYHQHQYQASINPQMQPMNNSVHPGLSQQSQKQASLQQQSDQQLYSNYNAAHHMGKSQSTPNMSCQLNNQLQPQAQQCSPYNINHWVIQEAELRRLHYTQQQGPALMARSTAINKFPQPSQVNPGNTYENHVYENSPFRGSNTSGLNRIPNQPAADTMLLKKSNGLQVTQTPIQTVQQGQPQAQPVQQSQQQSPSHGPLQLAQPLQSHQLHQQQQQQKQMLSVSGKKKCSNCGDELGRGCAAMVIETLALYYHINCFRCSVCHIQLGNGTCGTDVRVRNHKLHCHNCYSNDEAGLKFSRV